MIGLRIALNRSFDDERSFSASVASILSSVDNWCIVAMSCSSRIIGGQIRQANNFYVFDGNVLHVVPRDVFCIDRPISLNGWELAMDGFLEYGSVFLYDARIGGVLEFWADILLGESDKAIMLRESLVA